MMYSNCCSSIVYDDTDICSECLEHCDTYQEEDCEHENATFQPWEKDVNAPESYSCDDCGEELDLPEPYGELI
jgi:hypothetical protein